MEVSTEHGNETSHILDLDTSWKHLPHATAALP
jgi:hypothetical protein